jgi:hypothetical protein
VQNARKGAANFRESVAKNLFQDFWVEVFDELPSLTGNAIRIFFERLNVCRNGFSRLCKMESNLFRTPLKIGLNLPVLLAVNFSGD